MSTELAQAESRLPTRREIDDLGILANHLSHSGLFKDAKGGAQAFAKLLFGHDLGLSATAAMTGVHIIEGKPEISANIQAQMVRTYIGPEGERYDYRVREHDNQHCRIEFFRRWEPGAEWELLGGSEYSLDDAKRASLVGKGNWSKHPRNMLFARALSDGVAFHCPEVTNGIRVYHEQEIDVDGSLRERAEAQPASRDIEVASGDVVDAEVADDTGDDRAPALVSELLSLAEQLGKRDATAASVAQARSHNAADSARYVAWLEAQVARAREAVAKASEAAA